MRMAYGETEIGTIKLTSEVIKPVAEKGKVKVGWIVCRTTLEKVL